MNQDFLARPAYPARRREESPETMPPGYPPWYYSAIPAPPPPPAPAAAVAPGGIPKLAYNVQEAAEALGVSTRAVYDLVHRADFPSLKVGKRWKIPVEGLAEWVRKQSGGGGL